MSQEIEVTLPKLGESIVGATVVQLLKKVGEPIAIDEALLEVSTEKVNSEIPSPVAGILKEILVVEDQEIEVGSLLARIDVEAEVGTVQCDLKEKIPPQSTPSEGKGGKEGIYSPAVLRLAQMEGISIDTLSQIDGTGEGGRITKKDLKHYLENQNQTPEPPSTQKGAEERVKLSGMRKAIADNMVRSFYGAPHASVIIEADVTDAMELIAREKARFQESHGAKLTVTSFLIQALTKALQQFPMLNASLEDETIVIKRYINVGIAVNVEKGLIVPVIKNCQERNLVSIVKAVADLSSRARENKLAPDEVSEGTITLTNFGMTGALMGVPIIRYPEVAIIGVGTIQKRVVVREDNSFAVRRMVYLSLTFDHRIIDGIYGCQFLSAFKNHLESFSGI
ncbi:MAG: Dihydrolipoyllysine-residue acetyltransferase component of pyruvate dehydrogenase complex [Chlamydiae bacterium]|nr:Dihydrolipoyllysine-residue acetyltransferase component of pyruvate dehydrogenase complex [Chlamydiota bacterium]